MKIEKKIGTAVARRANELHSYNLPSSETQGGGGLRKFRPFLKTLVAFFAVSNILRITAVEAKQDIAVSVLKQS